MADPLLGRTVAHYEILSRLGGGGMGVVYKAHDRKLGRHVALKFLPQQWSHDEGAKQRFVREAQAASATHHPNICTVHDIVTADDGQLFIVMGFYEGPTLKQRLESGPLPVDEALDIATQIADGLAKAHAQGVVHRDVKPGNVILTEDGVRIVDFGLATFADALQLTTQGSTLGTAAYMSPEQIRGEEADARTDVWALGVVLYEMVTGHVPFRGSHAEAIAYAIRHDAPASIRVQRPEVPEEVEQFVFRALHKSSAVRFSTARDLSRALRQIRGFTLPQDLRTMPTEVSPAQVARAHDLRRRPRRAVYATAAIVAALGFGVPAWVLYPVDRLQIAVAPVNNQTGYLELQPYRMALTQELVSQLTDARTVRVLPYERLLQIVRRFREGSDGISSREAQQAIATHGGARLVIVPTLLRENDAWKARAEIRDPANPAAVITIETDGRPSALPKAAAYDLTVALARRLQSHFTAAGPLRASVAAWGERVLQRAAASAAPRLQTMDAAEAFERGLDAYERMEYSIARAAFGEAAQRDSRNPLPLAWRSRVAALMRQDSDAVDSADAAARLSTASLPVADRLFVEAVIADVHGDADAAGDGYRALVDRHPDEPSWLIELGLFQDRQGRVSDAAATYLRALELDSSLARPQLELCRLYSPSRANDPAVAQQRGEQALQAFRTLGNRGGEAQALWCLTDVLRAGNDGERREARRLAETALQIMESLRYPYGLTRANNYLGVVTLLAERNATEAVAYWGKTLDGARETGNRLIESRALMNLGVSNELLGRRKAALQYYRDSFTLCEGLRDQQTAAWNQVNAAAILIDFGGGPDEGLRDAQNALSVFQSIGDKHFEVFAHRMIASYYRHVGRAQDAARQLSLAESIADEGNLDEKRAQVQIDLARLRMDAGDYGAAEALLIGAQRYASGTDRAHARIELARALTRLGRFDAAAAALKDASNEIAQSKDVGSLPLLHAARGELSYESERFAEAREHFTQSAALWTEDLPEASSVEATAYAGLLDALAGRRVEGRKALVASLEQARTMRRRDLEARVRVFLARVDIASGGYDEAVRALAVIKDADVVGLELRGQVHYWRSRALAAQGDDSGARDELQRARDAVEALRTLVPESDRTRVLARPDIRLIG